MARYKLYSSVFISNEQRRADLKYRLHKQRRICSREGVPDGLGAVDDIVACINAFIKQTVKDGFPALYNHLPDGKFTRDDYNRFFRKPGCPSPYYLVCLYFLAESKAAFLKNLPKELLNDDVLLGGTLFKDQSFLYEAEVLLGLKELTKPVSHPEANHQKTAAGLDVLELFAKSNMNEFAFVENMEGHPSGEEAVWLDKVYVERKIEKSILEQLLSTHSQGIMAILGEAGYGKTSVLWHLHQTLNLLAPAAVLVKAQQLHSLTTQQLQQLGSGNYKIVLIDTVDVLLHEEQSADYLQVILRHFHNLGLRIVLTSRPAEFKRLNPFIKDLGIADFPLSYYDEEELPLAISRHLPVFAYQKTIDNPEVIVKQILEIASNNKALTDLCRTPLTLRMLFSLYRPFDIPSEINVFRLYNAYWERKVARDLRVADLLSSQAKPEADLSTTAMQLALLMLSEGEVEISPAEHEAQFWKKNIQKPAIAALLSRGVIKGSFESKLSFFHQTFFEHAAARALFFIKEKHGLALLRSRIKKMNTESEGDFSGQLFLAPVLQQFLLLASTSSLKDEAEDYINELLQGKGAVNQDTAIYAYTLFTRPTPILVAKVQFRLQLLNKELIKRFLDLAPSISQDRAEELFEDISIIWRREIWNERYSIIQLLEYIASQHPLRLLHFFKGHGVVDVAIDSHKSNSRGRHSEILRVLIRLLFRIIDLDQQFGIEELRRLAADMDTVDLLYVLTQLPAKQRVGEESLERAVITRLINNYDPKPDSTREFRADQADIIATYWIRRYYSHKTITSILNDEILPETNTVLLQVKTTALFLLMPQFTVKERLKLYDFFLHRLEKYNRVKWGKWLFARLMEYREEEMPDLLELFLNALNRDFEWWITEEYKMQPALELRFRYYFEAFTKADNVNVQLFNQLNDSHYLNPELWEHQPRIVDIFVTAYLSGYRAAQNLVNDLLSGRFPLMSEAVIVRFHTNMIAKKSHENELAELVVKLLLNGNAPTTLNGILNRAFNTKEAYAESVTMRKLLKKYAANLWHYIEQGLREKKSDKEFFGRLWATCVQHEILPQPQYIEVLAFFEFKRGGKYKVPVLLNLLPLCAFADVGELEKICSLIRKSYLISETKRAGQCALLQLLSAATFDLSDYQQEIISLVQDGWITDPNDDKIKYAKRIIMQQANVNLQFAAYLLLQLFSLPQMQEVRDRKRNEIAHDLRNACVAVCRQKNPAINLQLVTILDKLDGNLARPLLNAFAADMDVFKQVQPLLEKMVLTQNLREEVQLMIKELLNKQVRHSNNKWRELED